MHIALNLRQLRTFVAIVDAGGVGHAAARLHVTQPTASRQIHALETDLGVKLFDRIGRRVQLTAAGEEVLARGRRLLSDADSLCERVRALKTGNAGMLRIATTPQTIESLLVGFLARYQPRHRGVEIRLLEDGGVRLPGRLERGEADVTIMPQGDGPFHSKLLYPVCVMAVMPRTHRLSRRTAVEITELANEPLLLMGRGFASREWFYAACQHARIQPKVFLESAAPQTLMALAGNGYGIAVIPSSVSIPRTKVRASPLVYRGSPIGKWTTVAWNPQRFLPSYAEQFVEELVKHTRRIYPNSDLIRRARPLSRPRSLVSKGRTPATAD